MVEMADIISPNGVVLDLKAGSSKRQVLKELAAHAAEMVDIDAQRLLDALMERERLGTTGIGHGIAIPHARMAELKRLVGLFARLDHPVDFEALDDQPSDLIFLCCVRAPRSWRRMVIRRSAPLAVRACCSTPAASSFGIRASCCSARPAVASRTWRYA
jgi:mannitol/fructose-specific phosphotransferase system IIA component (Ntr-type)